MVIGSAWKAAGVVTLTVRFRISLPNIEDDLHRRVTLFAKQLEPNKVWGSIPPSSAK